MHARRSVWVLVLTLLATAAIVAFPASEMGEVETLPTGQVQLRVGTRPPITLLHRDDALMQGRILGVAWDGRVWYAGQRRAPHYARRFREVIGLISRDGRARPLVTLPKDVECIGGAVSPDGRYLAFATVTLSADERHPKVFPITVSLMKSDGGGKRTVATVPYVGDTPAWCYRPVWSPDSTRLALPVREHGRNRIALVPANGGKREYLPVPAWADVTCPDWSRDGKHVAYSCEDRRWRPRRGTGTDWTSLRPNLSDERQATREERKVLRPAAIWVTDLRTGRSRPVTKTPPPDTVDVLPRWSPGGTQLAYARWEWSHHSGETALFWWADVRQIQADGEGDQAVLDPTEISEGRAVPASTAEGKLQWLPDGRRLVLLGCQQGAEGRATGLVMVTTDGKHGWPLTPGMTGYPKVSQPAPGGHADYGDTLQVDDFALSPDGGYAVAIGQLWSGSPAGLWRIPLPPATP